MTALDSNTIGRNLESARKSAGLTQLALAKRANIKRVQVVRMEAGQTVPRLDEAVRLAGVLKVPLQWLIGGHWFPATDLRGIALELYRIGIRDLEVTDPRVSGSFRNGEEVLVLAVSSDRPEPRVVEAIPYVLARRKFRPELVAAFADVHDGRARTRIAWLSSVTLALSQQRTFPVPLAMKARERLSSIVQLADKKSPADSLGHPGTANLSPIWRRWNITYAGTMDDFLRRSIACHAAFETTRTMVGDEL